MSKCKCGICNAPDIKHHCFDCGYEFKDGEEEWKDRADNPMCEKCHEKLIEKADALFKEMKEEEALRQEMKGRQQDAKERDRINGRY